MSQITIKYGPTALRGFGLQDLFYSNRQSKLVPRTDLSAEVDSYICYSCRRDVPHEEAMNPNNDGRCMYCFQCPLCMCMLTKFSDKGSIFQSCTSCYYTTQGRIEAPEHAEWIEKFQAIAREAPAAQLFASTVSSLSDKNSSVKKTLQTLPAEASSTHLSLDALAAAAKEVPQGATTTLVQRSQQHNLSVQDTAQSSRLLPVPVKLSTRMTWLYEQERLVKPSRFPDSTFQMCLNCTWLLTRFSIRRSVKKISATVYACEFLLWNVRNVDVIFSKLEVVKLTNCSVAIQGNTSFPLTLPGRVAGKHDPVSLSVHFTVSAEDVMAVQWVWEVGFSTDMAEGTGTVHIPYFVIVTVPKSDYAPPEKK